MVMSQTDATAVIKVKDGQLTALVTSQTDATAGIKAKDGQLTLATAEELAETEDTATAAMETSHGETHRDTVNKVGKPMNKNANNRETKAYFPKGTSFQCGKTTHTSDASPRKTTCRSRRAT